MENRQVVSENQIEVHPSDEDYSRSVNHVEVESEDHVEVPLDEEDLGTHEELNDGDFPMVGMQFNSAADARTFYQEYGKKNGFGIQVRSSLKGNSRSNEITAYKYVCLHGGTYKPNVKKCVKNKVRNTSTRKGGCKAQMWIFKKKNDKWEITSFSDEHNHVFVTPRKMIRLPCNRQMSDAAKNLVDTFNRENLHINKVVSVFSGDALGFNDRDCWNYLRLVRHRSLEIGDAQSVISYFQRRQVENPQFFYAIQCDEEGRATNFFWVDANSRMLYKQFGDVVTFDTTYRTNKYEMPFAPFTGVNHHFQSIQFGCALLQDETVTTFQWLFRVWLQAMGDNPPISIITNQDLGMKTAISEVFPSARHRLCIWHIKKKIGEKLSHLYFKKSKFKNEFKKCIWQTYKIDEFERMWNSLMLEFNLVDNEWLKHLYEIRASWVPVYNRTIFFAGMNTTGRSEGANAFFYGFVSWKSSLSEFVKKYEVALKKITIRERDEDYETKHKYRIVDENNLILKHASKVYTRNIFDKFKGQLDEILRYRVDEGPQNGDYHTYIVTSKIGAPESLVVKLNLETHEGECECHLFEFLGILCRHMLVIFNRRDIDVIPSHFINKRWTQGANKFKANEGEQLNADQMQSKTMRLGHLVQEATQMACLAQHSEEAYKVVIEGIRELIKKISSIDFEASKNRVEDHVESSKDSNSIVDNQSQLLLNHNISLTKGRKRNELEKNHGTGRIKSSIELSQAKKRKCASCKGHGHDKRNCPMNPKTNEQGLGLKKLKN